jgi:P-type conjugative transfer protein TrbJ
MRRQSQHMVEGSLRVAATVIEQLPQTQAQFDRLVASSQGAAGILQATQAGNQMLAMLGGEMMKLSTMLAHFQQVTVSAKAQENVEENERRKAEKKLFEGWESPMKQHSVRPDGIW